MLDRDAGSSFKSQRHQSVSIVSVLARGFGKGIGTFVGAPGNFDFAFCPPSRRVPNLSRGTPGGGTIGEILLSKAQFETEF